MAAQNPVPANPEPIPNVRLADDEPDPNSAEQESIFAFVENKIDSSRYWNPQDLVIKPNWTRSTPEPNETNDTVIQADAYNLFVELIQAYQDCGMVSGLPQCDSFFAERKSQHVLYDKSKQSEIEVVQITNYQFEGQD